MVDHLFLDLLAIKPPGHGSAISVTLNTNYLGLKKAY